MTQPTRLRRPRRIAAAASLAFAFALTTCDRPAAGPGGRAALAVEVVMPASPDLALFNLTIDNVRLIVVRPPADTVFDEVFAFPANQTELPIEADIPLEVSPETFQVTIHLLSGTQVLFSGTQDVSLTEGTSNPPAQLLVTYSGPGQNVASLTIGPLDSVLTQGGTLQFRLTARDGQGAVVPNFYASWTTSDTTIARVDATGLLTAPLVRNSVNVLARTANNVTASTPITFIPAPNAINVVSGCGQRRAGAAAAADRGASGCVGRPRREGIPCSSRRRPAGRWRRRSSSPTTTGWRRPWRPSRHRDRLRSRSARADSRR
jgi:hypothetical protein